MVSEQGKLQRVPLHDMRAELARRGVEFPEHAMRAQLHRLLELSADKVRMTTDQLAVATALERLDITDHGRHRSRHERWYRADRHVLPAVPGLSTARAGQVLDELFARGLAERLHDPAAVHYRLSPSGWQALGRHKAAARSESPADKIRARASRYLEEGARFRQALAAGQPLVSWNHDGMWAKVWENVGRELNEVAAEIDKENDHE